MNNQDVAVIILAAGKGTRMKSKYPKVCHEVGGISLIRHVIIKAQQLNPGTINVVVGDDVELIKRSCQDLTVNFITQEQPQGTAHAVQTAVSTITEKYLLVIYADTPLITITTLNNLLQVTSNHRIGVVTSIKQPATGYGRIIRNDQDTIIKIVEERDATNSQRQINEIFTGLICMQRDFFVDNYHKLSNDNSQQEYYLPEMVNIAATMEQSIPNILTTDHMEIQGVNDRVQLAIVEKEYQNRMANKFLQQGITLLAKDAVTFRGENSFGQDCVIDRNVIIINSKIGNNVYLGPNTFISNAVIGDDTNIEAYSHIDGAVISAKCKIGPFARLRPGTELGELNKIGNFVEIKNTKTGSDNKINHLSYVGDSVLGKHNNLGAGTITCNYDGEKKHTTIIEDDVFVGSGCELVAPVTIGSGAIIGAGSTITKDAPTDELTLSRVKQATIVGWKLKRGK